MIRRCVNGDTIVSSNPNHSSVRSDYRFIWGSRPRSPTWKEVLPETVHLLKCRRFCFKGYMEKKLLNVREVQAIYGASPKEQWLARKGGDLPFIRRGRRVFYLVEDAERAFMPERRTGIEPECVPTAANEARRRKD